MQSWILTLNKHIPVSRYCPMWLTFPLTSLLSCHVFSMLCKIVALKVKSSLDEFRDFGCRCASQCIQFYLALADGAESYSVLYLGLKISGLTASQCCIPKLFTSLHARESCSLVAVQHKSVAAHGLVVVGLFGTF